MSILPILFALSLQRSSVHVGAANTVQAVKAETLKVAVNSEGNLTVRSAAKQPLSFYLFDLEGTLIYQSSITQHQSKTIEGLSKGTYSYTAFQNDESVEEGKVTLK